MTPPEILDPGTYTWSILCWNCDGYIESEPMEFTVCTSSSFPGRATLVSPKDNIGGIKSDFYMDACFRMHSVPSQGG